MCSAQSVTIPGICHGASDTMTNTKCKIQTNIQIYLCQQNLSLICIRFVFYLFLSVLIFSVFSSDLKKNLSHQVFYPFHLFTNISLSLKKIGIWLRNISTGRKFRFMILKRAKVLENIKHIIHHTLIKNIIHHTLVQLMRKLSKSVTKITLLPPFYHIIQGNSGNTEQGRVHSFYTFIPFCMKWKV